MNSEVSTVNPLDKFIQAFIEKSEGKNSVMIEAAEKGSMKRNKLIEAALKLSNEIAALKYDYKKSLLSPDLDSCVIKSKIMCKQQELDINIEVQTEIFDTAVTF